jgi:heme a synthase
MDATAEISGGAGGSALRGAGRDLGRYRPDLHWAAWAVLLTTFPLIFLGGLVTSHQAGMSVPDWPNSWGYNMFLLPPSKWLGQQAGGVFYEHSHRLLGSLAGLAAVVLALLAWGPARRPGVRRLLGIGVLACLGLAAVGAVGWGLTRGGESLAARAWPQSAVGAIALALVLLIAWISRTPSDRPAVRWTALAVLGAVIAQGVLGGLRVVLVNLDLAIIHGCFAQAFFCLCGLMVAMTSRWWVGGGGFSRRPGISTAAEAAPAIAHKTGAFHRQLPLFRITGRGGMLWAVATVVVIYVQLVIGATMRHYQAGLAIPDLPLAYGRLIPPADQASLREANFQRILMEPPLDRVTLWQTWIHFAHRLGALAVAVMVIATAVVVIRSGLRRPSPRPSPGIPGEGEYHGSLLVWPAGLLLVLLAVQLTLGWLTVTHRKPADIASYHVAVGALTLLTAFTLAVRAGRMAVLAKGIAGPYNIRVPPDPHPDPLPEYQARERTHGGTK